MRIASATVFLTIAGAVQAQADDLPTRKAGLWEIRPGGGPDAGPATQECTDAATDRIVRSVFDPWSKFICPRRAVSKAGDTITIDGTCKMVLDKPERSGPSPTVKAHAVISGSFESAYTVTVTAESDALPGGARTMTMAARWLGPCAAGQKPGDIIMGGGIGTINVLGKRAPQ